MERTLKVINSLVDKGVIRGYAIGGGMAAAYYGEPTLTYDLDLFVHIAGDRDDILLLTPIYEYLAGLGYKTEAEGVVVEGIRVQFLPPYNALIEEAIEKAVSVRYGSTDTRMVSLEHLVAIMVQTFRPKDKLRLANLLGLVNDPKAKAKLDIDSLADILIRHKLKKRWDDFVKQK